MAYFSGWRDDIYQLISAADVVMLCSTECESFGLVLAEAMVLSKPSIGANIGGVPEVIDYKQTDLLFTSKSVDSLADAMILLTVDAQIRKNFGNTGRQCVT